MPAVLITGTSRGIGLELVRQYAKAGWRVFACYRNSATTRELSRIVETSSAVSMHWLDVTDHERIAALASELRGQFIDLLLNNAGIMGPPAQSFGENEFDAWPQVFRTNVVGPLKIAEAFVEQVAASERKLIVSVSSGMGSIADNVAGGSYAYRASKAALNMVSRSMAVDLRPRGITVVVINPGWVKTDMGGASAVLAPEESVSRMRAVISRLTVADSGKFLNHDGSEYPW